MNETESKDTLTSLTRTLTHCQNVIHYNLRDINHHFQRARDGKTTFRKALEKVMQITDLSQIKEIGELLDSQRHNINHLLLSSDHTNAASTEPVPNIYTAFTKGAKDTQ